MNEFNLFNSDQVITPTLENCILHIIWTTCIIQSDYQEPEFGLQKNNNRFSMGMYNSFARLLCPECSCVINVFEQDKYHTILNFGILEMDRWFFFFWNDSWCKGKNTHTCSVMFVTRIISTFKENDIWTNVFNCLPCETESICYMSIMYIIFSIVW